MVVKFAREDVICCISGYPNSTEHHVLTRKARPDLIDAEWNKCPLRQDYHQEIHNKGLRYMTLKYPAVRRWLLDHGWFFDVVLGRWDHPMARFGN